jgi:putative membrane protein
VTPFDPGLQPERTALAWRRTAQSLAVGSLAAGRLLQVRLGGASWLLAVIGVVLALGLLLAARRRAVVTDRALRADRDLAGGPGAALPAAVTVVAVLVGVAGLVLTVGFAASRP